MNVSLTPELEAYVEGKVESGRYTSASEVVREALRLLEETEASRAEQLSAFNRELARRLGALKRGEYVDAQTVREHFAEKSRNRRKKSA
jgi:antitoxin ParD1/3/4